MRRLAEVTGLLRVQGFQNRQPISSHPLGLGETACLIADVNMPVMTGVWRLYKHLIDSGHAIPVILVTAYADDDVESRALKDGVLCYLRKPVDEKQLERWLLAAFRRSDRPGD